TFLFYYTDYQRYLHSFPTRRSSDLQRRSEHDDCDGCHFLFALDRLGPSSARGWGFFKTSLCPKRRDDGSFENPDGSDFLHGRLARSDFDSFPADFAELSAFWEHLRR